MSGVLARLANAWDADNNTKIAAWEQQVREDQEAEAEATLAQELADRELEECRKEEEAERKEKPKLKDLAMNKPVRDTTQLHPLCFTMHKLEEHDYIELHYFML